MKRNKPYTVIYIQGYGHSGTTILDILLGSSADAFSCGELTFINREGIADEFCSCNNRIGQCSFWSPVMKLWSEKSTIPLTDYKKLRNQFEGNRSYLRVLKNQIFPSQIFRTYIESTELLYDTIYENCGTSFIIDSSKQATRPFVLTKFAEVQVLHICRNFRGVLNSEKKNVVVDLKDGIETPSPPKRTLKVLLDWLISNLTCACTALVFNGRRIHFRQWVVKPELLTKDCQFLGQDFHKKGLKADHMIAGNRIRLLPSQKLRTTLDTNYQRLTKSQHFFGKTIEILLPFWSK
jgi:hypothetical protein